MEEIKDVIEEVKDTADAVTELEIPNVTESVPDLIDKTNGLNMKTIVGVAGGVLALGGIAFGISKIVKKRKSAKIEEEYEYTFDDDDLEEEEVSDDLEDDEKVVKMKEK